ncbi:TIGR03617 family F420-dependent LLM class oxidoreductase [Nocardioides zeae]|uniref:F420-dependent oxidoreductase n=1 Tax=Nocardioides zeae TaxID=1457234 RepID=A0AAJ1U3X8_9ACTN|nr:TIGR03617 family F420-dependent LLM class oxidoreductase [Nocardioides zeae]MDQ1105390.1 putative F420-dependent oxidoreductase [Nocardioides zeae]
MKIDLYPGFGLELGTAASVARTAVEQGYDGLWALEAPREPFSPLAVAALAAPGLQLRTSVAVAFARNPMVTAGLAHELARVTGGGFVLGLGTQVRAHVERRFSETWSEPVQRMADYVAALRAIWACWNEGVPLEHVGSHYRHTLMTPMFDPGPSGVGAPPVHLAAVGPAMVAMATEVADGLVLHPLTSPRTYEERVAPAVGDRRRSGGFELTCPVLVATGTTDEEVDVARHAVRKQIAFYASTPAYRWVLDLYGEGERADRLRQMSREGRWDDMTALVTDELLDEFAVTARQEDVPAALEARWGAVLDRAGVYQPY